MQLAGFEHWTCRFEIGGVTSALLMIHYSEKISIHSVT